MHPYLAFSVGPYPNSALSAGQLALIAVISVLLVFASIIAPFVAAREPRHRGAAGTTTLPQQQPRASEQGYEQPEHKAA
jgi:hypothetical protein